MFSFVNLPFNVDVTHVFSSDACFIQNDISRVPNDDPQEVPVLNKPLVFNLQSITL